jgi:hypothetical protein
MDAGTNALVITGPVYPLKQGFIGVVNRSQQDMVWPTLVDNNTWNNSSIHKQVFKLSL